MASMLTGMTASSFVRDCSADTYKYPLIDTVGDFKNGILIFFLVFTFIILIISAAFAFGKVNNNSISANTKFLLKILFFVILSIFIFILVKFIMEYSKYIKQYNRWYRTLSPDCKDKLAIYQVSRNVSQNRNQNTGSNSLINIRL